MHATPIPSAPTPRATGEQTPRARLIAEFVLTAIVTLFLAWLAQPMGELDVVLGLGNRYESALSKAPPARDLFAVHLAENLGTVLALLAGAGWLALRLARSPMPRLAVLALQASAWLAVLGIAFTASESAQTQAYMAAAACFATGLVMAYTHAARCKGRPQPPALQPVHALAYPGWVLFTGLGLLWLVDYSARSYFKLRYVANSHVEVLFMAYVLLGFMAAWGRNLMAVLARALAALDRARTLAPASGWRGMAQRLLPLAIPLLFAAWALAVVLVFGKERPALTSELMRLPFYAVGGWVLYRWADQGQATRALLVGMAGIVVAVLGLGGTGDFGQVLLIGLGLALASGTAVAMALGGNRPAILTGVLVAVAVVSWGLGLINEHGHLVSRHIGWRADALSNPFAGRLEYLSELRWFAAATPAWGHGLTQVPWCGTLASLAKETVRCNGVPQQMQSDYVFAGLAGVWGLWTATLITTAMGLWLVSLVQVRPTRSTADPADLRNWVYICFVAVTLAQLFFTSLGSLGVVALTGVTYPLMSIGSASLLATAAFVGLALHR